MSGHVVTIGIELDLPLNRMCNVRTLLAWCSAVVIMFTTQIPPRLVNTGFVSADAAVEGNGLELESRNTAFLNAVEVFDVDSMLAFFPRTGEFTYTFTFHHRAGDSIGIWRFPATDARSAVEGPLRGSLTQEGEFLGIGSFASALAFTHSNWRRVGEARFVPPPANASSGTYVEWRREGRRWVVAAFGDEGFDEGMEPPWIQG